MTATKKKKELVEGGERERSRIRAVQMDNHKAMIGIRRSDRMRNESRRLWRTLSFSPATFCVLLFFHPFLVAGAPQPQFGKGFCIIIMIDI